jgi:hypothetical protein
MPEVQNTPKTTYDSYMLVLSAAGTRMFPKEAERVSVFSVNEMPMSGNSLLHDQ